jgi:serine/threonine protein kinase
LFALHSAKIIHRDIKPENIVSTLANKSGARRTYKICDLGISKVEAMKMTMFIGTCYYMAPEMFKEG